MSTLNLRQGQLHLENLSLATLAERFGTPLYVYSRATLEANYLAFDNAFADIEHQVCFAVKANSNLAVLNVLARLHDAPQPPSVETALMVSEPPTTDTTRYDRLRVEVAHD